MEKLGLQVEIDDTAQKATKEYYCNDEQTAPTTGNLIGFLPATDPDLPDQKPENKMSQSHNLADLSAIPFTHVLAN